MIRYDEIIKIGDRSGTLTIIETPHVALKGRNKCHYWQAKVRCDCGVEQNSLCPKWIRKEYDTCQICKISGKNSYKWNGCGEITGNTFYKIRHNAILRGVEHSVSNEYLWNLFIKQNRKCALSGLELKFKIRTKDNQTASLDRIDSSKGYVDGNVQWIHKDINRMKNAYNQKYYISICKLVANLDNGLVVK
jgi:hypothetical protein